MRLSCQIEATTAETKTKNQNEKMKTELHISPAGALSCEQYTVEKETEIIAKNPFNDWGLADPSGADGDPNPMFDKLVRMRAMVSVWRRLEYFFPQIERIGGWRFTYRDYVKDFVTASKADVGGAYGPATKAQWFELAKQVLLAREAWQAGRVA